MDESLKAVTPDKKNYAKKGKRNRIVRGGDFEYRTILFVLYTAG
jgi:hypothetical protein